jgi:hypothetical protein
MAAIPEQLLESKTVRAIYDAYVAKNPSRFSRRLGASMIGKECERAIWFDFRWAGKESFDGRMLRLFQTGHLEEHRFVQNLKDIGCEVHAIDDRTGEQFEFISVGGHFVAKLDGVVLGVPDAPKTWHTVSMKTHNAKSFKAISSAGVKSAKPEHYAQAMIEMHLIGFERCLYLAVNKDTDDLFAERIHYSKTEAEAILDRAQRIISSKTAPPRISDDKESVPCRWCKHADRCHGSVSPVLVGVTCRSCVHSTPVVLEDSTLGSWRCDRHKVQITESEQSAACEDHLFIPDFITFAKVVDGGYDDAGDWIQYQNADGSTWRNSKQVNDYRSVELTVLPSPLVGAGIVADAKSILGGEVIDEEEMFVEHGSKKKKRGVK